MGVTALVLVLNERMERNQRKALQECRKKLQSKHGKEELHTRDENKMVGWAIFRHLLEIEKKSEH